jgi:hypothetical protein
LNDGQIQNPSAQSKIAARSQMDWRCFGFVHHSRTVCAVPNPIITIRNFCIAVRRRLYRLAGGQGRGTGFRIQVHCIFRFPNRFFVNCKGLNSKQRCWQFCQISNQVALNLNFKIGRENRQRQKELTDVTTAAGWATAWVRATDATSCFFCCWRPARSPWVPRWACTAWRRCEAWPS